MWETSGMKILALFITMVSDNLLNCLNSIITYHFVFFHLIIQYRMVRILLKIDYHYRYIKHVEMINYPGESIEPLHIEIFIARHHAKISRPLFSSSVDQND